MLPDFNVTGIVYIIRASKSHMVKVGYTSSGPLRRLAALQTGSPEKLSVVAAFPGSTLLECSIHRTLKASWSHGEWFSDTEEVRRFVADMYSLHPFSHETRRRAARRSSVYTPLPGDPDFAKPKQARAVNDPRTKPASIGRASVVLCGNQWRARVRLPDGTRPSVALGPSTWSKERARACSDPMVELLASRITMETRASGLARFASGRYGHAGPTPSDHEFILECLKAGVSADNMWRAVEGECTWEDARRLMDGLAHWAREKAS